MDDQPEFREFARELLEDNISLTVVGEAPEAESAFQLVKELMPDIVLMDLDMPEMNGLEAIEKLRDLYPAVQTVLVSIHDEDEYLPLALEAGVPEEAAVVEADESDGSFSRLLPWAVLLTNIDAATVVIDVIIIGTDT